VPISDTETKQWARPAIGVGITTRNRNDVLATTRQRIEAHTLGAHIVVVVDASAKPVDGANYRFDENVGIARAKNKCLELLDAAGCKHLFLFDDDTYPSRTAGGSRTSGAPSRT
jgi:hypothetical protein